jgi:hypothetical protein
MAVGMIAENNRLVLSRLINFAANKFLKQAQKKES